MNYSMNSKINLGKSILNELPSCHVVPIVQFVHLLDGMGNILSIYSQLFTQLQSQLSIELCTQLNKQREQLNNQVRNPLHNELQNY